MFIIYIWRRFFTVIPALLLCVQGFCQNTAVTDTLKEAVVVANAQHDIGGTQTGLVKLDGKKLNSGFSLFSSPDVIKRLQSLPGVSPGIELFSNLYVHGGDGSDNLFCLDGIPFYQVGHVGGLFSVFDTNIIENINFYKSGFPAQFGGRLSSVVDINTKDGNTKNVQGKVSLNLIDGKLFLEGPLRYNKSSFMLSLRRSWIDLFIPPILHFYENKGETRNAGYCFYDITAKASFFVNNDKFTVLFYSGRDSAEWGQSSVFDGYSSQHQDIKENNMLFSWGSTLGGIQYYHSFSNNISSISSLYCIESQSKINYYNRLITYGEDNKKEESLLNEWSFGRIFDLGANTKITYNISKNHCIVAGASVQHHRYTPSREATQDESFFSIENRMDATEASFYIDDEIKYSPKISVTAGFRFPIFISDAIYQGVEPRIAVAYAINSYSTVNFSYTRMAQFNHLVSSTYLEFPTNVWMPSTEVVKPKESNQIAGGITFSRKHIKTSIGGYWKDMHGLLMYDGINSFFPPVERWEADFYSGEGKSYGFELMSEYKSTKLEVSTGYTLGWSWRKFLSIYKDWFPDHSDNRNTITIEALWRPSQRFDVNLLWSYHTGNRQTLPSHILTDGEMTIDRQSGKEYMRIVQDLYSAPNGTRLPDYHRLDIGCNFRKQTRNKHERVWNVSIYNAYCHLNPLYIEPVQTDSGRYIGRAVAIIPIIPSVGYSLSF